MTGNCIVVLTVINHPGVMSHITGLFSRRAFNLEGILCAPIGDGEKSRMYLLVNEDERLDQIIKQLEKLYDVQQVVHCEGCDISVFERLHEIVGFQIPGETK